MEIQIWSVARLIGRRHEGMRNMSLSYTRQWNVNKERTLLMFVIQRNFLFHICLLLVVGIRGVSVGYAD